MVIMGKGSSKFYAQKRALFKGMPKDFIKAFNKMPYEDQKSILGNPAAFDGARAAGKTIYSGATLSGGGADLAAPVQQQQTIRSVVQKSDIVYGNGDKVTDGHVKTFDGLEVGGYEYVKKMAEYLGTGSMDYMEVAEIAQAARDYTGSAYRNIRSWQSGTFKEDGVSAEYISNLRKTAADVERYIAYSPKWGNGGKTYRGIRRLSDEDFKAITTVGAVIDHGGSSASWSSSRGVAKRFAGGAYNGNRVILVSETQSKGATVNHLSKFKNSEWEVLVSREAKYSVTKVSKPDKNGVVFVYVDEVLS